jgi:hypothetical protein
MNKLVRILNETENKMRLTTEQRITALERDNVVLHDTKNMMSSNESGGHKGDACPADALYTFKCKRRFEGIEKHIEKMHKLMEESKRGLKAG